MNGFVRPVRLDDAERIASIYNKFTFETEPVSVEVMRGRINAIASAFPYFVNEYDGVVLGYCYAHPWKEREAYSKTLEATVYLAPEACHQGIGSQLMRHLIEDCRHRDCHALIACEELHRAAGRDRRPDKVREGSGRGRRNERQE